MKGQGRRPEYTRRGEAYVAQVAVLVDRQAVVEGERLPDLRLGKQEEVGDQGRSWELVGWKRWEIIRAHGSSGGRPAGDLAEIAPPRQGGRA